MTKFGRQNALLLKCSQCSKDNTPPPSLCYYLHEDARAGNRYTATVQTAQRKKPCQIKSNFTSWASLVIIQ